MIWSLLPDAIKHATDNYQPPCRRQYNLNIAWIILGDILVAAIKPNCVHYNDAIMSVMVSQITSLTIVYSTVKTQIKENIKAPRHWPLCGEFTGDRWIPRTKGQWRGKCFHLMMSSWLKRVLEVDNPSVSVLLAGSGFHCDNHYFKLLVMKPEYSGRTGPVPWLLMPWFHASPVNSHGTDYNKWALVFQLPVCTLIVDKL